MNKKLLLIAGAAITSAGVYSASVIAAQGTGQATANIVEAITIAPAATLAFGDIVGGTAGTVILDTANGVTGTLTSTGTRTSGTFDVDGEDGKTFSITLPASALITDPVSTDTMTVNAFTDSEGGTGTIPAGTAITIGIGATLNVLGTETAGSYTGTYNVDVDYN